MNVFTSTGYDQDKIATYNQKTLSTNGYMQSSNDWKNIEMTGYVKLISGSGDTFTWYARGGKHSDRTSVKERHIKVGWDMMGKQNLRKSRFTLM